MVQRAEEQEAQTEVVEVEEQALQPLEEAAAPPALTEADVERISERVLSRASQHFQSVTDRRVAGVETELRQYRDGQASRDLQVQMDRITAMPEEEQGLALARFNAAQLAEMRSVPVQTVAQPQVQQNTQPSEDLAQEVQRMLQGTNVSYTDPEIWVGTDARRSDIQNVLVVQRNIDTKRGAAPVSQTTPRRQPERVPSRPQAASTPTTMTMEEADEAVLQGRITPTDHKNVMERHGFLG